MDFAFAFLFIVALFCSIVLFIIGIVKIILRKPAKPIFKPAFATFGACIVFLILFSITYEDETDEVIAQSEDEANSEILEDITSSRIVDDIENEQLASQETVEISESTLFSLEDYPFEETESNSATVELKEVTSDSENNEESSDSQESNIKSQVEPETSSEETISTIEEEFDSISVLEPEIIPILTSTEVATNREDSDSKNDNGLNKYDISEQQKTEESWILNKNTMKVHVPSCSAVSTIKPENYATSNLSLEELKAQGYTACGRCKPF